MFNIKTDRRECDPSAETLPARKTSPGSVGWLIDDAYVRNLVRQGIKVRIKTSHDESRAGNHETETIDTTRVIFSLAGNGLLPGRRLAELTSSTIDAPCLTEVVEALRLTVFGLQRRMFHRERLFDGPVQNRTEAIDKLRKFLDR